MRTTLQLGPSLHLIWRLSPNSCINVDPANYRLDQLAVQTGCRVQPSLMPPELCELTIEDYSKPSSAASTVIFVFEVQLGFVLQHQHPETILGVHI